jgi:hypothetical protein
MQLSVKKYLVLIVCLGIYFNLFAQNIPSMPSLMQPYNNSTNVPINIFLSWYPADYAETYDVQVSYDSEFSNIVFDEYDISYTSIQVKPDLSEYSSYYWRVRAHNSAGYGAWSNPPWYFYTINEEVPMPPRAVGPYNGDVNLPTTITFFWEYTEWANSYRLQVATDPSFSSPITVDESSILQESRRIDWLTSNTNYYWRVKAVNNSGYEGIWSDTWKVYTGSNTSMVPPPPTLSGPYQDDTDLPTGLTFLWEYTKGADYYYLQVSTDKDFNTLIVDNSGIETSWEKMSSSPLNTNTDYYWRVKARNESGQESIWSETRHFRTGNNDKYPEPPALLCPYSGAGQLPTEVTLFWDYATGADLYQLQVSSNGNFTETDIIMDRCGLINPRAKVYGLENGVTYYWHVKAYNEQYDQYVTSWSGVYSFSVSEGSYPATPSLSYPYESSTDIPPVVQFNWEYTNGADSYGIEISKDNNFSDLAYQEYGIPSNSKVVQLNPNTSYYWRVFAININGSSESSTWNFTTRGEDQYDPGPPLLFGPRNGESGLPYDVTLFWLHEANINSFDVEVASDAQFSDLRYQNYEVSSQFVTTYGLSYNNVYYWRVRTDVGGTPSEWSDTWCFVTGRGSDVPAAPKLIGPNNDDSDLPYNPTLFWGYAVGAQSYQLQISKTADFSDIDHEDYSLDKTFRKVTDLMINSSYYWRVKAVNPDGEGPWSEIRHFSIGSGYSYPDPPGLKKPDNYKTGLSEIKMNWGYARGADFYTLEMWNSDFSTMIMEIDSLPIHFMVSGGFSVNTTYYWRIKAWNENGESSWSDQWQFTTWDGTSYPSTPSLRYPNDYEKIYSINPVFQWEESWGAESYHLQVATDEYFGYTYYDENYIRDTKWAVGGLSTNTTYYWRVEAKIQDSFSSGWSDTWRFTIQEYSDQVHVSSSGYYDFPADPETRHYKIFGIPGDGRMNLADILGSDDGGKRWQAHWDNGYPGSPEEYLEEYSYESSTFNCVAGRAFWVIMNDQYLDIERDVPSAPIENGYAVIELHDGWNMITNPFNFEVNWNDIRGYNDIDTSDPIWEYNEGFFTSGSMVPCKGYYFYNRIPLDELRIPYQQGVSVAKNTMKDEIQWEINISLDVGDLKDIACSFGVAGSAAKGEDNFDYKRPRAIGELPSVSFERPEWDKKYPSYARDIRPPVEKIETWEFDVFSSKGKDARLSFGAIEDIPETYQVYLLDKSRAKAIDLRKNSSYTFLAEKKSSAFAVCVGNKESIQEELDKLLPREFALLQNYPNPFNPETVIPLLLPEHAEIELTVYNILGQSVRTLYKGKLEAGRHYIAFNGSDPSGNHLPSGLYFIRLTTNKGHNFVKKMVLIK